MKGLMILASDKHGIKDKVVGKLKEVEGKITKATDLKETLEDKKEG